MAVRVDLNGIKSQLKILLDAANSSSADPIDLSANMSARVIKILKINPEQIPTQSSHYPLVTCYIESKPILSQDICKDQLTAKRKAKINIVVMGAVWNQNFKTVGVDPADEDINYLMENIELTLRANPTLGHTVNNSAPTNIAYYGGWVGEGIHLRAGFLSLEATVYY
jgi:hypothetical protein